MEEIIGKKFTKLTIVAISKERIDGRLTVDCICDCGTKCTKPLKSLKSGNTKSCGCYRSQWTIEHNTKHNKSHTRLYSIWLGMKKRCYNSACKSYKDYGELGITVCDSWKEDFEIFEKWSIENGYKDNLTIDRKDNMLGYNPNNCQWIPKSEQSKNRKTNNYLVYKNETKTLTDWSKYFNTTRSKLYYHLDKGLTLKDMVEKGLLQEPN